VRLLCDSSLPASLELDAPADVELKRWTGPCLADEDLASAAAQRGFQGVVVLDRNSLHQPSLRQRCAELGLSLIAVEADDPLEAKDRVVRNIGKIRSALADSQVLVVLARTVRPQ